MNPQETQNNLSTGVKWIQHNKMVHFGGSGTL